VQFLHFIGLLYEHIVQKSLAFGARRQNRLIEDVRVLSRHFERRSLSLGVALLVLHPVHALVAPRESSDACQAYALDRLRYVVVDVAIICV